MRRGAVLRSAWTIARSYWFSEEKWSAWLLLISVISLNLVLVYITVQLNLWQSDFYQVIQNYNQSGFIESIEVYALLATLFIVVKGYQIYARLLLHNRWRRWLTERYLTKWLQKKTYYRLQLMAGNEADNPDQRISEDVELFVMLTLRLSVDFLQDAVTVFSFVLILWSLSGVVTVSIANLTISIYGYLVWLALGYAIAGTYWTLRTGRPLVRLEYNQQRYEADFRFSLVRIRENAESIALYNGENKERQNCLRHFNNIVTNFMQIIAVRKRLMWLTTGYSQVAVIFSILISSPRYFLGQIHLGQMFQVIDAYHHVQTGFSFIIDSFTRLAQWRAVVNRLNNFLTYMETVQTKNVNQQDIIYQASRDCFTTENVTVFQPDGYGLVAGLSVKINRGGRVVITGPSGCGKSTVLRTLAGIWPFASGNIAFPHADKIMFVPQKSYMPIDTLREVLLYPGVEHTVNDQDLQMILTACKLPYLTTKLNEAQDWGQVLSLGEQQRIAFARALLQKPDWLFLDEATSALDEDAEQIVYALVCKALDKTAIISVGHRKTLLKYHQQRLELDDEGGWSFGKC
ncbi:ABC transporter ATP-binding protein/permease [Anaerospora sp.]|uniref:ABC transporter ATP-binding protein/permease n=1 Tax=Anaerospora sp. TaxID=1960278 RepID=UPI002898679A|nr:ABC transporter ATP-binding protein/permease [Anaerospora sp.]